MFTNHKTSGLGRHQRRNNLLVPLSTVVIYHLILCGLEKVQIPLLVRFSRPPLRSLLGSFLRTSIPFASN